MSNAVSPARGSTVWGAASALDEVVAGLNFAIDGVVSAMVSGISSALASAAASAWVASWGQVVRQSGLVATATASASAAYAPLVNDVYSETARNSRLSAAVADLMGLAELRDGWNGAGSLAPSRETIGAATALIQASSGWLSEFDLAPNENGTVSVEWENRRGYVHLELGRTRYALTGEPNVGAAVYDNGLLADLAMPHVARVVNSVLFGAEEALWLNETSDAVISDLTPLFEAGIAA